MVVDDRDIIQQISIHTPRVGGDLPLPQTIALTCQFQSTPPAWGATEGTGITALPDNLFRSTSPAWGATSSMASVNNSCTDFDLHPLRGGRHVRADKSGFVGCISIHIPRVGGDRHHTVGFPVINQFRSTPPAWGATRAAITVSVQTAISIHTPRVGGDCAEADIHQGKV